MNNRQRAIREVMIEHANKPFEWGVRDCCMFAAAVAERVEGVDFSRGYDHCSEATASAHISAAGSLESLITNILDRPPVELDQLAMADPVLVDLPGIGPAVGVFNGADAIVKTTRGAVRVASHRITKGWHLNG